MNEFSGRFTVVIDSCVLFNELRRDLIFSLAAYNLFRLRWSNQILKETRNSLERYAKDKGKIINVDKLFANMTKSFPDAQCSGHEILSEKYNFELPDPDDNHVLALAIMIKASVIVTDNLKDFPNNYLEQFGIESKSADEFIADSISLSTDISIEALKRMRIRYKRPTLDANLLIQKIDNDGLKETASVMKPLVRHI